MGYRSLIELNHDLFPANPRDEAALLAWARAVADYVRGGDPRDLPPDVVHKGMRHSSEPCPLAPPAPAVPPPEPKGHRGR